MNLTNFIRCVLRKNTPIFCNDWNFFSNVKYSLKKLSLNSCRGVVVIAAAQLHSIKPDLRFCTGSDPAGGVLENRDDEDL